MHIYIYIWNLQLADYFDIKMKFVVFKIMKLWQFESAEHFEKTALHGSLVIVAQSEPNILNLLMVINWIC